MVFFICGGINLVGATVYLILAENEVQEWAKSQKGSNELDAKLPIKEDITNGKLCLSGAKEQEIENGTINKGYNCDISVSGANINAETKFSLKL